MQHLNRVLSTKTNQKTRPSYKKRNDMQSLWLEFSKSVLVVAVFSPKQKRQKIEQEETERGVKKETRTDRMKWRLSCGTHYMLDRRIAWLIVSHIMGLNQITPNIKWHGMPFLMEKYNFGEFFSCKYNYSYFLLIIASICEKIVQISVPLSLYTNWL